MVIDTSAAPTLVEAVPESKDHEEPLLSGFVYKRLQAVAPTTAVERLARKLCRRWLHRFVVITPSRITWSSSAISSDACLGSLDLAGATATAVACQPTQLRVRSRAGAELVLDAGDEARATQWKAAVAMSVGLSDVLPSLGDFGDVAHSAEARALAAEAATGPRGAFHSALSLRSAGWVHNRWHECYGVVANGMLALYESREAPLPFRAVSLRDACAAGLSELEDCRAGHYCFALSLGACDGRAAEERLTLCAPSSHEQLLWLQALVGSGTAFVQPEEPPAAQAPAASLFELRANDLDCGAAVDFRKYEGEVCLVVNVASR